MLRQKLKDKEHFYKEDSYEATISCEDVIDNTESIEEEKQDKKENSREHYWNTQESITKRSSK